MRPAHLLLALGAVTVWGSSYVAIAWGLQGMPPIILATLRFACAAVPLAAFVPRPKVPWRLLCAYSACMFIAQFGLLFSGIHAGLPAGLASLVMQCQAFFTLGLGAWFLGENPRPAQVIGVGIALIGMGVVGLHIPVRGSLPGFGLVVLAGFAWSLGNLLTKRLGPVEPLALVVWASLLAIPGLLGIATVLEGPTALAAAVGQLTWRSVALVLFQAYFATLFCFIAWSHLLKRYPVSTVAPFSLLVPVIGLASGVAFLGEPASTWKLGAAALVIGGLALSQLEGRLAVIFARS